MASMYGVATTGCNIEIMGYPFYAESVSPNEAIRRRNTNVNAIVGGTQKVTKGDYVALDFDVTTHIKVDPTHPDQWDNIFKKMMANPVEVSSPELASEPFKAMVIVKREHSSPEYLKVSFNIKEVPDKASKIPGEDFTIPAPKKITSKKSSTKTSKKDSKSTKSSKSKSKKKTSKKKSKSKSK